MRGRRLVPGLGRGWLALFALSLAVSCSGDGEDDTGSATTNPTTGADGSGESGASGDDGNNTTSDGGSDTAATTEPSTGDTVEPDTGLPTDGFDTLPTQTSGGNMCDPVVKGEWNACAPGGMTDNTLCNWVGDPDANGFIGCLNSSEMDGHNVCMISGCVDDCDCFAPPQTGTAEVICGEVLADGGTACVLDCSAGQTCPDGMDCVGNICFHPA